MIKIKNKYFKAALTSLTCTVIAGVVMTVFQFFSNNADEERKIDEVLAEIPSRLDNETEEKKKLIEQEDAAIQKDISAVKFILESLGQKQFFETAAQQNNLNDTYYLVNGDGVVVNGTDDSAVGRKISQVCSLSVEETALLLDGEGSANTSLHTMEDGTPVKFYSASCGGNMKGLKIVAQVRLNGHFADNYTVDAMNGLFGILDDRCWIIPIFNDTQTLGTFYTYDSDLTGQPLSVLNLDESITKHPSSGKSSAFGFDYKYKTIQYSSDILGDITILGFYTDYGAVPFGVVAILLVTILLVTFLIQLYSYFIDEAPGKIQLKAAGLRTVGGSGLTIDTEKARVLAPYSLLSIVFVTVAGLYLNSLEMISGQVRSTYGNILHIERKIGEVEQTESVNYNAFSENVKAFSQITASLIEENQDKCLVCKDESRLRKVRNEDGTFRTVQINNPWLGSLAEKAKCFDMSIFDAQGNLLITGGNHRNLSLSSEDESLAEIFDVAYGVSDWALASDGEYFLSAVPLMLRSGGEIVDAMLVSRYENFLSLSKEIRKTIIDILEDASESGNCQYVLAVDGETRSSVYFPKTLGPSLKELNLPDASFEDMFIGFKKANDTRYMLFNKKISGKKNNYTLTAFIPVENVYEGRTGSSIAIFVVTLLTVLALIAILTVYGAGKTRKLKEKADDEMEKRKKMTPVQLEKISEELKKEQTPSQKILGVMKIIWRVILFCAFSVLLVGLSTTPQETFSGYLMTFIWERGINLFSITTMLLILMSFSFVLFLLKKLMSMLGSALNAGAETVCQLIVSLLRYIGYITVIFVTLFMFGVDTTGVLASLGAFSVMVGLGAKNLITDILAGIYIVMEKDYKVGDIINIGGFCGKVTDIGIRSTKVEDIGGNVKIFANSTVSGVINMTTRLSAVTLDIKIDAEHSFAEVEEAFLKFFRQSEDRYTQIRSACRFLGVQDASPTVNVYRIMVPCDEVDRAPLRRALLRDFNEFCEKEGLKKQ